MIQGRLCCTSYSILLRSLGKISRMLQPPVFLLSSFLFAFSSTLPWDGEKKKGGRMGFRHLVKGRGRLYWTGPTWLKKPSFAPCSGLAESFGESLLWLEQSATREIRRKMSTFSFPFPFPSASRFTPPPRSFDCSDGRNKCGVKRRRKGERAFFYSTVGRAAPFD